MKTLSIKPPIEVVHLFPVLEIKLLDLLRSLMPDEWQAQTIAQRWQVKDVVAHLLDGNIRVLSMLRDGHFGESPEVNSYQDLVDFLNGLNADWVKAMKRVSPNMLILLHELTGKQFCDYYATLDLHATSAFSVAWAGETESKNWLHLAREYTEKWLHQQQIRDAVNKPGLMTRELFYPFIDTFMYALPHTYREITAEEGTNIKMTVLTDIGGFWYLNRKEGSWQLSKEEPPTITTEISITPDTAWKLFSKSLRPEQVKDKITITGDQGLGEIGLNMVSVMA